ncbi:acylneuraminate cytidylyltransferase [Thiospirochaeta perfilievii]|uniref:Acylneuraminate cytidylyltransferase n=1 Tax=Thiospirochaeta perfilievii TaxID=252967 RepID=A0A5C1Q7E9_9SPIO|nr:acylneuraminate cytidylyltransferase [Thiospirochaeta perfilievii]QEN03238.1 acylneuraminate cytidylyltransferase [Thiospirochaeta perfilievii]
MRGVLLQVRLDSTRLPKKALLKIENLTVIEHAMKAAKKITANKYVLVTTEDSFKDLKPLAVKQGYDIFIGDKDNVLDRFVQAINYYALTQVVRATGDNPLVSYELANILIDKHNKEGNDYSGFLNNPLGTGVEVINSNVLIDAHSKTSSKYDREHVTPYIYNNKNIYKVFQGNSPQKYLLPGSSVTIDTSDDYNRIVKLFHELYHGEIIPIERVVKWLKEEQLSSIHI